MLREVGEEIALVAERERVARDVHDVLGHSLTVVVAKAELAERLVDLDPERAKAEIASIRSLSREALGEVRATVSGLRVARLGDELASAREALTAADIVADVPSDPDVVDPRRRIVVAWVLREAVTNVVRHSGASRCTVELGDARLAVSDDGRGGVHQPGNGLRGIGERVRAAGGTLTVTSGPEGGTRLEVTW
nr:sensor histidine kinase [Nocardioides zeae]